MFTNLWERFLLYLLVWASVRLGYSIMLWVPPDSTEIRVLHLFDTETNLHLSISQYMRQSSQGANR